MYSPGTLTVNAGAPWNSVAEFIRYAKAHPGKIRNSNSGTGASAHIIAEAFDRLTGIKQTHVPFNGFAPAVAAVAGGHVEATCIPVGDVHAMVKGGKLRLLAVAASERHFLYPNVPTMKELKIDLDMGNWVALCRTQGGSGRENHHLRPGHRKGPEDAGGHQVLARDGERDGLYEPQDLWGLSKATRRDDSNSRR